jgi:hypothetical protein
MRTGGVAVSFLEIASYDEDGRKTSMPPGLGLGSLLGIRRIGEAERGSFTVEFQSKDFGISRLVCSRRSKIEVDDAKIIAKFNDGLPAITVKENGKGKMFYFAFSPERGSEDMRMIVEKLLTLSGVAKPANVIGKNAGGKFIDCGVLAGSDALLLSLANYGDHGIKIEVMTPDFKVEQPKFYSVDFDEKIDLSYEIVGDKILLSIPHLINGGMVVFTRRS